MNRKISLIHRVLGTTLLTGYSPYFPGTLSSLVILCLYPLIAGLSLIAFSLILLILTGYLFFSVGIFEKALGKDPSQYTMDESIATFILVFFLRDSGINLIIGFILWRILDIAKPLFIGRIQKLHGAWGVLLDDLAAVAWTFIFLFGFRYLFS